MMRIHASLLGADVVLGVSFLADCSGFIAVECVAIPSQGTTTNGRYRAMAKTILVLCAFLAGCTMHFTRPDYTEAGFQKDWTNCQAKAGQAGLAGNRDFLRNCMVGEGWTPQ